MPKGLPHRYAFAVLADRLRRRLSMATPTVLIVDDEKNLRLTLAAILESFHIPSETAKTGKEALHKLAEKSFQLILLDLRLPDLDGLELLRLILDKHPDQKVVFMTAYGSIEVAVEAMKNGAVDFLPKPLNPNVLREVVRRVLESPPEDQPLWKYDYYLGLAKQNIAAGEFDLARAYAQKAIYYDSQRPEAFNVLGGIREAKGDRLGADKNYRIALEIDPTYKPAQKNLARVTRRPYALMGIAWD
jgi:DNA-binding response OmpR family regulator